MNWHNINPGGAEVFNSTWRKSKNVETLKELEGLFKRSPEFSIEKDPNFKTEWTYFELSRKQLSSAFWRYNVMKECW